MLAKVKIGLKYSIIINEPKIATTPAMRVVVDCDMVLLILSISLVRRLLSLRVYEYQETGSF